MSRVTGAGVHRFRLRRSHLEPRAGRRSLLRVVADVCGVQAQFLPSAELALWARIEGLRRGDMERALWEERTLVRTWTMRGTLHLHTREELPVYVSALGPSRVRADSLWLVKRAGSQRDLERVAEAVVDALATGPMTRAELAPEVVGRVGEWARPLVESSWGGAVRIACLQGLVCYGPDRDRSVTFARTDRWLGRLPAYTREEAQDALVERYLRAYGPATVQDLWRWANLPMSEARPAWERARPDLVEVDVGGGRRAWARREDAGALRRTPPRGWGAARLLGGFDGYLLAHEDRAHLVAPEHAKMVFRKAGWISQVALARGRVVGTWRHTALRRLSLTVVPFARPTRAVRSQVLREAVRLGGFLGLEAGVAWS